MPDARMKVKHRLCVDRNLWKPFLANAQAQPAKLAFVEHLQSTIYNLQSAKLGGLSPADMRGLYHRSRPRLRVSLRSLATP